MGLDRKAFKLLASARQNPSPAAGFNGGIKSVLVSKDTASVGPKRIASVKGGAPESLIHLPRLPLVAAYGFECGG